MTGGKGREGGKGRGEEKNKWKESLHAKCMKTDLC
jgi:hypothetical protein